MKKLATFLPLLFLAASLSAQHTESAPTTQGHVAVESDSSRELWDVQFSFNTTEETGGEVGMAAVAYVNGEFWVSLWAGEGLFRFLPNGDLVEAFSIAGLAGTRSFSYDGTYLYASVNSSIIYRIDPVTRELAPPHINSMSGIQTRYCAFDPTLDGGAGGFWTGNFASDIFAISMNGTVLSSIPASAHGLSGIYGATFDNTTPGGPFLWLFDQGGMDLCQLNAFNLTTGEITAEYDHNTYPDVSTSYGLETALAGGVYFTSDFANAQHSLICLLQGTPNNVLVVYEISGFVGVSDLSTASFQPLYPNPAVTSIQLNTTGGAEVRVIDQNGKLIRQEQNNNGGVLDVSQLSPGLYLIQVSEPGRETVVHRFIKE